MSITSIPELESAAEIDEYCREQKLPNPFRGAEQRLKEHRDAEARLASLQAATSRKARCESVLGAFEHYRSLAEQLRVANDAVAESDRKLRDLGSDALQGYEKYMAWMRSTASNEAILEYKESTRGGHKATFGSNHFKVKYAISDDLWNRMDQVYPIRQEIDQRGAFAGTVNHNLATLLDAHPALKLAKES